MPLRVPKTGYKYGKPFVSIHVRRPPLDRPRGGNVPPRPIKPRRSVMWYNNAWQEGRYLKVANRGFVEACEERGVVVKSPDELFTSHMPSEFQEGQTTDHEPLALGPFEKEEDHPHYHPTPVFTFDKLTYFPTGRQLEHAKVLCKAVEVQSGLPERLASSCDALKLPDQDEMMKEIIKETQMLDATQQLLPLNVATPYIGWHPVEDRMHRKMPYDVTKISWGFRPAREYGIPTARKNMNLARGLLRCCDTLAGSKPSLLNRVHMENTLFRQYFEHGDRLVRFFFPLQQLVSDVKPLPPYADRQAVARTENIPLPDIYPLLPTARLFSTNVYNDEQSFPILRLKGNGPEQVTLQHAHTGIEHLNSLVKAWRKDDGFHSQACALGFMTALGQARLIYGNDVKGILPSPVTVNFISTDGIKFHFSAFQLNTLELGEREGVKNIFWHDPQVHELYQVCEYRSAIPTFEGYNPDVLNKFAALYMENA